MLMKINTVTQFHILLTLASAINIKIGRVWFMWDAAKCKLHRKLVFQKDILFASEYVNFERNANQDVSVLDNLCSKDLPDQIPENVPDKIITDTKALIFNKYIRQSFNGLDYDVSFSHRISP